MTAPAMPIREHSIHDGKKVPKMSSEGQCMLARNSRTVPVLTRESGRRGIAALGSFLARPANPWLAGFKPFRVLGNHSDGARAKERFGPCVHQARRGPPHRFAACLAGQLLGAGCPAKRAAIQAI